MDVKQMEQPPPLVSIIIPCYNQAQYLPDALESVLAQTYTNWECIIVNDGSPDNTEEVVANWLSRDKRFRYFKKDNGGQGSARNAGLAVATGRYIQFLDADDYLYPEKLAVQLKALKNSPSNALSICDYFTSQAVDLSAPHPYYVTPEIKSQNPLQALISDWGTKLSIPIHCFLFDKSLFDNHHIAFREDLPNNEDWDCWISIFIHRPDIRFIDNKLVTYRIQQKGTTSNRKLMKSGWLQTINIQKAKFDRNSEEFRLLEKKYNHIKYGINSRCELVIGIGIPYYFARRSAGYAYRFLKQIIKRS